MTYECFRTCSLHGKRVHKQCPPLRCRRYHPLALHPERELATLASSLLTLRYSPSPYECAVLSARVYQENLKEGAPVVVHDGQRGTTHTLQGWAVSRVCPELPTTRKPQQLPQGYRGVLYVNRIKQQMVLAHRRGTRMCAPFAPSRISFFVNREKLSYQFRKAYQNKTNRRIQLLAGPGGDGEESIGP